jgi:DNA-binding Lrp family transcriptional regulator
MLGRFEKRKQVVEFCDRRQGRKQLEEWIRLATKRPFRTDQEVDGRRRNLPSTREWFIKGILRMFETDAFLNYKHHPAKFRAEDDARLTSYEELMRMTRLTESALKACLREFSDAGVIVRDSKYVPALNRRFLYIRLNGARMLEILAEIPEVKKRRVKGDDFTSEQIIGREFKREDIKTVDLPIQELRKIDEPMANEREETAENEVGTLTPLTAVNRPSTLRVNSQFASRFSVLTISGVSPSKKNDLDAASPQDGRKKRMIPKSLRDIIVLLGSHLFEGQKFTPRHVKLLTRWYRSSSSEEHLSMERVLEVLQFSRNRDETFLEKQSLDSFCLFWPWIYRDITRAKMEPFYDTLLIAKAWDADSIDRIVANTCRALSPEEYLLRPGLNEVSPEYLPGRFICASLLGMDMQPLVERFGKALQEFFLGQPHLYEILVQCFPVADWVGGGLKSLRVEHALADFKSNQEQATALRARWGELAEK